MAKIVNPPAELEALPDDVDLPLHLLSKLAPFTQLKAPPSLDKYPGACRLRYFRTNEEVCAHGEPGWSAYCFVPETEIVALRDYATKCLEEGPANCDKAAAALAKAEAELQSLANQLGQKDLAEKDKKDLEKKRDSTDRERDKQQAALALLDEERARLPEVCRRFDTWLKQRQHTAQQLSQHQEQAASDLPKLIAQARRKADAARVQLLDEIPKAPPDRQRQLADLLEPAMPKLAGCLQALAAKADGRQRVALARLPRLRPKTAANRGWLPQLRGLLSGSRAKTSATPTFIPGDGPRDLDYESRLSSLYDGELIGEISCLNRTPRSATITMARDGFAVELMRHILDLMGKDTAYQERVDGAQRQRLINSALREIPLFADLPEAELATIGHDMEFLSYEPGSLICDEHEEADCLYVIGNGIIKVVTGVSWLLPPKALGDAVEFRKELAAPAGKHAEARSLVAKALSETLIEAPLNHIIKDPHWRRATAIQAVVDAEQLMPQVWRMMAAADYGNQRGLVRCNRLVLNALDSQAYPALKAGSGSADEAFGVTEFGADWKKLCARLVADDKKPDDPAQTVWPLLPAAAQDVVRRGRTAELASADREAVVSALNSLLRSQVFLLTTGGNAKALATANLAAQLLPMFSSGQLWSDFDFHRWNRCLHRLTLQVLCPQSLKKLPRPSGLPDILSYRSRNEILGEIGLVEKQPRTATLVTYNHPKNDPKREVGPVQLYRIGKAVVDDLLNRRPELRKRLEALAAERRRSDRQRQTRAEIPSRKSEAGGPDRTLLHSPRGEQLGLIEGQKLMLIDLDRCTRCDECVRACVNTHDDDHSRLFLVGPRQAQYLVPATCRSCLDPVCMIGCPVNSIQRGDNKEIIIRDWCIGCERCAQQCPYGSIQMHDTGLIPAAAQGWLFAPAPTDETWTAEDFDDEVWLTDASPFSDDALLDQHLARFAEYAPRCVVAFRRELQISPGNYQPEGHFQMILEAPSDQARVWLNGVELRTDERFSRGKRKFVFGPAKKFVRPGANLLAAWVPRPAQATGTTLFSLRLDAERDADSEAVEIKLVTSRAVVCDLCSSLSTGPACVTACPHEAAMRINATGR